MMCVAKETRRENFHKGAALPAEVQTAGLAAAGFRFGVELRGALHRRVDMTGFQMPDSSGDEARAALGRRSPLPCPKRRRPAAAGVAKAAGDAEPDAAGARSNPPGIDGPRRTRRESVRVDVGRGPGSLHFIQ